jgi:hypothetical protein
MFLIRRTSRVDWPVTVEPAPSWEDPQVWTLIDLGDPQATSDIGSPLSTDEP